MSRDIAIAIACGLVAALLYLSLVSGWSGGLALHPLAQLPLFLVGLSLGVKAMAVAGATGSLASLAAGNMVGLGFCVVVAAPALVLVTNALRWRSDAAGTVWWYPPGPLVMWAVAMPALALGVVFLVLAGGNGIEESVRSFLAVYMAPMLTELDERTRADLVTVLARVFPGTAAALWVVIAAANAISAQAILARLGAARRPSPDMVAVELPAWASAAFAVVLMVGWLAGGTAGYVASNTAIVLMVAFAFAGLAVVHAAARSSSNPGAVLFGAYAVMLVFNWWAMLVVAGLGFIEQWAGLRRRFALLAAGRGER
jgi:hypothetical protein